MKNNISAKNDIYPLLKLAIPLALTGLVQSATWFFETLFLAHLGPATLAAGSLVSWFFGTLAVIMFGALSSINILVAHKHGTNDVEGISFIARDGLILAIILTIPAIILLWNMAPIFSLFGQSGSVVALASSYLHALAWGILANFISMACLEVLIGVGKSRTILIFSILSVSLNIFCSYVLIFGKFGFAAYGIAGAGWGMTISYWVTLVVLLIYIFITKHCHVYFKDILNFNASSHLIELLQIGIPMGGMYCVEVAFFFALTLLMGLIGNDLQAANQVAMQYLGLFMSMIFALAQAITVRMGHLIGAEDIHAAKKASYLGIAIAVVLNIIVAIFYWLTPDMLISIDFDIRNPNNLALINMIKQFLAICAVFQIIESARIAYFGSLRALKDTRFTMLTSIISFWCIALPIGYILAMYLHVGGAGYWWGMVMGAGFSVVLLQWRFKSIIRRYIK
ncbi:MAG: MATE family efflux transporter [Gammaproteobacteria bacterium]|nr:MATE family efflux transporter [Gammaproteobacteria bacterium]MCW5583383.1 MATE family efflux transporter [Gammaproteobacteria bacterium]